jgi:hypothetical protein
MFLCHRLQWLFSSSTALFPSLYLSKQGMSPEQRAQFAIGRMNEAVRVAQNVPTVNAYIRYLYHDVGEFLTQVRKRGSAGCPECANSQCLHPVSVP